MPSAVWAAGNARRKEALKLPPRGRAFRLFHPRCRSRHPFASTGFSAHGPQHRQTRVSNDRGPLYRSTQKPFSALCERDALVSIPPAASVVADWPGSDLDGTGVPGQEVGLWPHLCRLQPSGGRVRSLPLSVLHLQGTRANFEQPDRRWLSLLATRLVAKPRSSSIESKVLI